MYQPNPNPALLDMNLLLVDDEPGFLELFQTVLELFGYTNIRAFADSGEALEYVQNNPVDLILSDLNMPGLDGMGLLRKIKENEQTSETTVVIISGAGQMQNVIQCLDAGAEDYLSKPIEKELLWSRVNACLERKHLRDQQKDLYRQLEVEKKKSDSVLFNVIPRRIAERLRNGESTIAEPIDNASILFADIARFTDISKESSAERLVEILNNLFGEMDDYVKECGIEKIKTVGDCYMCVCGLESGQEDHADRCVAFARKAIMAVHAFNEKCEHDISIRIGIASGPLVAGIIGYMRPIFDVWGEAVNLASRMESHGLPGRIQLSECTYEKLNNPNGFVPRGTISVKGIGELTPYISAPLV